jgi:hypothetical protein
MFLWGLLLLFATCKSLVFAANLYTYRVYKTDGRISVDGKAEEPVWSNVKSTMMLSLVAGQGSTAKLTHADSIATIYAKAIWDSANVYFYFWVDEQYIWNHRKGRDTLGFWMENAVEIYFDDIGDNKNFMECNLAPNGSITDIFNAAKYSGTANNTVIGYDIDDIATGVMVQGTICTTYTLTAPYNNDKDTGFAMEVKIPFASLKHIGPSRIDIPGKNFHTPPHNLDSFRINLYYSSCAPKATVPNNNDRVNYAWNTTVGSDFHETSKFGTMIFIDSLISNTEVRFKPNESLPREGKPFTFKSTTHGS